MGEVRRGKRAQIAITRKGPPIRVLVINRHKFDRGWTYSIGLASGPEPRQKFYLRPRLGWFARKPDGGLLSTSHDKMALFQIERGKPILEAMELITQYLQGALVFCYDADETREALSRMCEAHPDEPGISPNLIPELELISMADFIDKLEKKIKFSKRQTPEEAVEKATHRTMRTKHAGDVAPALRRMIAKMLRARRLKRKRKAASEKPSVKINHKQKTRSD